MSAHIVTIETPGLGDRSYLVSDGSNAIVIDPQRDIDRVLAIADAADVAIAHVLETHVHNDYVTGGLQLAREAGAEYVMSAADELAFEHRAVKDGERVGAGALEVTVIATPGHTQNHLAYLLDAGNGAEAVFTGGSLLFGTVGRTDLLGDELTEQLTRAQWQSARRLANELAPHIGVYPTHGFGSFCSSAKSASAHDGTVGDERNRNIALTTQDEDEFVAQLMSGLTAYPRYYLHMGALNRGGPSPVDLSPPGEVDATEIKRHIDAGGWVVDLRPRSAFAREHLCGTIAIESGDSFATYLGWLIPWGAPVTLVGDTRHEVEDMQREIARIGIDRPAGRATGGIDTYAAPGERHSYEVVDFATLAKQQARAGLIILDVRRDDEWDDGHIDGALHIPLPELEARAGELPNAETWVHCATGFRASIAASLLDRAGKEGIVLVDDDWTAAEQHGLPVIH